MRHGSKQNVVGVLIDEVDYEAALEIIFSAARRGVNATISALAVHGVMTGALDPEHRHRLNAFDLIVPDGQPVRWVLNALHRSKLTERVYGPELMLRVCERAAAEGIPVFLYGGTESLIAELQRTLVLRYPRIRIAGTQASKFRRLTVEEKDLVSKHIVESGAGIALIGLGCPRQEIFAFEFRKSLPMPVLAVGAAFPFIAGIIPQAPQWMQDAGLEWLFRLLSEPRRLWRRYLYLNPAYVFLVAMQALRLMHFDTVGKVPISEELFG